MQDRNYYDVLGVSRDATLQEIKKAYKKRAIECHPDKNNGSSEKMQELNRAKGVLFNAEYRKKYDEFGCNSEVFWRWEARVQSDKMKKKKEEEEKERRKTKQSRSQSRSSFFREDGKRNQTGSDRASGTRGRKRSNSSGSWHGSQRHSGFEWGGQKRKEKADDQRRSSSSGRDNKKHQTGSGQTSGTSGAKRKSSSGSGSQNKSQKSSGSGWGGWSYEGDPAFNPYETAEDRKKREKKNSKFNFFNKLRSLLFVPGAQRVNVFSAFEETFRAWFADIVGKIPKKRTFSHHNLNKKPPQDVSDSDIDDYIKVLRHNGMNHDDSLRLIYVLSARGESSRPYVSTIKDIFSKHADIKVAYENVFRFDAGGPSP